MNIYPFYQFKPPVFDSGFQPGLNYFSGLILDLFSELNNGLYVDEHFTYALNQFKATYLNKYNSAPYFGQLELIYPKPFPTISGVQPLEFKIRNLNLYSQDANQEITMILDLINGIVNNSEFTTTATLIPDNSDFNPQYIQIEKDVERALEIRKQIGSSFMPLTYQLDGLVAYSGLARGQDWTFEFQYPKRIDTSKPASPSIEFHFQDLKADEKLAKTLFDKIVQFGFDSTKTYSDVQGYIVHQFNKMPSDWSYTITNNSSNLVETHWISPHGTVFAIVGRFEYRWQFQRFYSDSGDSVDFLIDEFGDVALPYAFDVGLMYLETFYDLEFCCFGLGNKFENYNLPIKTSDFLQFNILPQQANLADLQQVKIGLFSCENEFLSEIGVAEKKIQSSIQYGFGPLGDSLLAFSSFQTAFGPLNTLFCLLNEDGTIGEPFLEYLNSEVDLSSLANFIIWFNTRPFPDYFSAIAEVFDSDKIKITTYYSGEGCYYGFALKRITFEYPQIPNWVAEIESIDSFQSTQFQSNVTIPFKNQGLYKFGLYTEVDDLLQVFAFSNLLDLNNADTFSRIIQFWGDSETLIEGFEYIDDWKQIIRIGLNGAGNEAKINESLYRNSDGTYQRPMNESDLMIHLQTDYIDLNTQKALFSATRHPAFVWDNQNLSVQGDLEIATTQDFSTDSTYRNLAQVKLTALHQGYQPDNNACLGC